ncbi:MAG: flagellar protein FlaG [Lachnospiraceae bacterium]|nr:flagellar protein FlaG [Lachnospiraceae bacterium]
MAVEPLSSVTSMQVEAYKPKAQPAKSVETTEGFKTEVQPMVDSNTLAVEATSNKDEDVLQQELNQQQQLNPEQIKKAVEDVNKKITNQNSELQFGIHEGTNRITIKVIDKETKKVIKELPPEKTLDMIAKAWELAGIMVDERR